MQPEKKKSLQEIFAAVGAARGVDPDLLSAVAFVESSLRADAIRWNPPNDVSVGVMQVLCTPPDGATPDANYVCQNRLDLPGWPVTFNELRDAERNVDIGAQILAWNIRNYGFPRGVAIYNDWSARHASVGGPFPNDEYVGRVLARLQTLKGE